ncbi:MAG: galactitol-1-phosphate 5-dehydrogenase [Candidatus Aerophobus sp.]|nr:MAG: galactitol-1-phosphate 5-dehydrogenase [Candidatus Aerophobus sp.]
MKEKMMAAVLHAPGDLRYEEVEVPKIGPNDVLLKVKAAGNCGSDLQRIMVEGTHVFPCIPGHEFSGEIVEIGDNATSFKAGDRVTAYPLIPCMRCEWCLQGQYNLCEDYDYLGSRSHGAFAEYVKIPAVNLVRLPKEVDFDEGAMTDPACIALHGIKRAGGIRPGQSVVILGTGPIGMLACQWVKAMGGGKVVAVDIIEDKLKIARELGVDVCVNAKKEDVVEKVMEETKGKGADVVMETAGSTATQRQSLLIACKRGKVIHIGRSYSDVLLPDEVFTRIFRRELEVYGAVNSNFSPLDNEWKTSVQFMASGLIKAKPLISHRIKLEAIAETFKNMYEQKMIYNKIIFSP